MSLNLKLRLALSAGIAGLLQACATVSPFVDTSVTVFHELPPTPLAETVIAVMPWRKELSDSLEFKTYAARIEARLRERGYVISGPGIPASHAMFVKYGIDDGRTVATPYSIPQFGVTGYSGSQTMGTVSTYGNTSYLNATTTRTPTYGVTGYQTGVATHRVFTRFVSIDIVQLSSTPETSRKVFEGRLRSEGSCGNFVSIMPILVDSLFMTFPGTSGQAVPRRMQWNGVC